MELQTIGIDLGKTVFHLVGLNLRGEVVVRKKFSRKQLLHFTANLRVKLIRYGGLGLPYWSVVQLLVWPADDAWLKPGLEIAYAIPTSAAQLLLRVIFSCQVCWRTMRWHNGRTRRSENP